MKRTIVFDLDGTLETPYFNESDAEKVQAWMKANPAGNTYERMHLMLEACGRDLPHFFLNGAFELLRWVADHDFKIVFFSNAVEERNVQLCPILMERAFLGRDVFQPSFRVLSRGDCIDTESFHGRSATDAYQGLWFGNYKKRLENTVVSSDDLPNTLMIEDDHSYACKGEERNFVYGVYGGCVQEFISNPVYEFNRGPDFHLPFYFCGMLKRIVDFAEKKNVSLAEAAVQVQYWDYGRDFPQDGNRRERSRSGYVDVPYPPQESFEIYLEGLNELRKYNPELKFWGNVDEKSGRWPKPNEPIPQPPKPVVKTNMTRKEADYWLGLLRQTLCKIRHDNIKGVILEGEDGWGAEASESQWMRFGRAKFEDEPPYFDSAKINRVRIYGYLPLVRDEKEKSDEHFLRHSHFEVNVFDHDVEIFKRVIDEYLSECFRLEVDWSDFNPKDPEHWSLPVTQRVGGIAFDDR